MTRWFEITSDPQRLMAAVTVAMAYVLFCFALYVGRRRHKLAAPKKTATAEDSLLVAFASQTGFAERIATQTADALRASGVSVALEPLAQVHSSRLPAASRALFVVSTTGEGDAPDSAAAFTSRVMSEAAALPTLRYGVLALGDRDYRNFCGFGRRLDGWLKERGAQPLFDTVEVDNGDEQALQRWRDRLANIVGDVGVAAWRPSPSELWRLRERRLANPGSAGQPTYYVTLEPTGATPTSSWSVGDIVEIRPRHAVAPVIQFLEAARLDGSTPVRFDGQTFSLADVLAHSVLPLPAAGQTAQAIADALVPLPYREFSIASLPSEGVIDLLVRQSRTPEGSLGLASGWLTEHAWPDARIELRIRANSAFRPPPDAAPLILIGNGTGVAGLLPHLKARGAAGIAQNWLVFGERNARIDFYYRELLADLQQQGLLPRADWVFSRDTNTRRYVQHALRDSAVELREWVERGAYIYVCGSLEGMAPGVDAALRETLGGAAVMRLTEQGRYRREVY